MPTKLAALLSVAPWLPKQAGAITQGMDDALRETYFAVEKLHKEGAMVAFEPVVRGIDEIVFRAREKLKTPGAYINKKPFDVQQVSANVSSALASLRGPQEALRFLEAFHQGVQILGKLTAGDSWNVAAQFGQKMQQIAQTFARWLPDAKFE